MGTVDMENSSFNYVPIFLFVHYFSYSAGANCLQSYDFDTCSYEEE